MFGERDLCLGSEHCPGEALACLLVIGLSESSLVSKVPPAIPVISWSLGSCPALESWGGTRQNSSASSSGMGKSGEWQSGPSQPDSCTRLAKAKRALKAFRESIFHRS